MKIFQNHELVPKTAGNVWCFNPGILRLNNQWVFVYRLILNDQIRRIALCRLDDGFNVVNDSIIDISAHIRFSSHYSEHVHSWFADPRIFFLGNHLYLYFNSGWHDPFNHQFIVELDPRTLMPKEHARELQLHGERQKIEKNWMFFGNGHAIYAPHRVLKFQLESGSDVQCEEIASSPLSVPLRGGAPPQYLAGHYYSFCHAIQVEPEGARYEAFAYRFSSTFPFTHTHVPKRSLPLPNPLGRRRALPQLNPAVSEVIYPCGAAFHQGKWVISYGINDEACAIATLTQEAVDDTMSRV